MENDREQTREKKPVRVIAAACRNMGIGKDGSMPWDLPSEFQFFLSTITRVSKPGRMNMVVWGKLCWFSHPETTFPLSNVLHVVLSKTLIEAPDRANFLSEDFDSAVRLASEPPLADLIETIWVVGGTKVYEDAMNHPNCDRIYLTDIMADFDCDVFFPDFDRKLFHIEEKEQFPHVPKDIQEENGIKYKYQVFKKVINEAV